MSPEFAILLTPQKSEAHATCWLSLAIVLVVVSACTGRDRINPDCQWTHDPAFQIDLNEGAHRTHLRHDADLLEDLAIRYADAHAGRVGRPEWAQATDACITKLLAVVGGHHDLSERDIRQSIGRRNLLWDLPVFVLFLVGFGFASKTLTRRLFNAWSFRGVLALVATLVSTVIISAVLGSFGALSWGLSEAIRLGSEHVSHRGSRVPWPHYLPTLFGAAFVICSFFAWREHQAATRRSEASDLEDAAVRSRVLFR